MSAGSLESHSVDKGSAQRVTRGLRESLDDLLSAALAPSSHVQYERAWKVLLQFLTLIGVSSCLPILIPVLLLFVAYLHWANYSPASITSFMSAISFFHKVNMLPDPASSFLINKAIAGARNISAVADVRLPITPAILYKLIQATVVLLLFISNESNIVPITGRKLLQ